MCKCTSYIIVSLVTALGNLLKLRHNEVIASLAIAEGSHSVMNLFTSISAKNNVTHLFIYEIKNLVI